MFRELKRVPLDFDWPLRKVWYGYLISKCLEDCDACKQYARIKRLEFTDYGCPDFDAIFGPPLGDGYQLWETTSEGSPISPVFKTIEELAKWCEDGATIFGHDKLSYDEWLAEFRSWHISHRNHSL